MIVEVETIVVKEESSQQQNFMEMKKTGVYTTILPHKCSKVGIYLNSPQLIIIAV